MLVLHLEHQLPVEITTVTPLDLVIALTTHEDQAQEVIHQAQHQDHRLQEVILEVQLQDHHLVQEVVALAAHLQVVAEEDNNKKINKTIYEKDKFISHRSILYGF